MGKSAGSRNRDCSGTTPTINEREGEWEILGSAESTIHILKRKAINNIRGVAPQIIVGTDYPNKASIALPNPICIR